MGVHKISADCRQSSTLASAATRDSAVSALFIERIAGIFVLSPSMARQVARLTTQVAQYLMLGRSTGRRVAWREAAQLLTLDPVLLLNDETNEELMVSLLENA